MNGWRKLHHDGSQGILLRKSGFWQARLLLNGASTSVGLVSSDLEEAKRLCQLAIENEHSHICSDLCQKWEVF